MTGTEKKIERITLRIESNDKALIARAAAMENLDLNSFILRAVLPAAWAVINRVEKIKLSARDTDFVLDLLDNPPEPTPKLMRAVEAVMEADPAAKAQSE